MPFNISLEVNEKMITSKKQFIRHSVQAFKGPRAALISPCVTRSCARLATFFFHSILPSFSTSFFSLSNPSDYCKLHTLQRCGGILYTVERRSRGAHLGAGFLKGARNNIARAYVHRDIVPS